MTEPAIALSGLTKIFRPSIRQPPVVALQDVSLRVAPGEVYGLLGPNGSGKSTTLKIILGLLPPTTGDAKIFGQPCGKTSSRTGIGFLPENPYFAPFLSGAETLGFYGKLSGLHGRKLRERVHEMLAFVDLAAAASRPLRTYSKGMLQRIGLAQALLHEPRILLLDEPTAGVDPAGLRRIQELILDLKRRGVAILFSSHLLAQAQEICDRVGILAQGRLVREGSLADLLDRPNETELTFADLPDSLRHQLTQFAESNGARLLRHRAARAELEQLFLDATAKR